MTVHYHDDAITLLHGDALAEVATLADESVNCIVTSPPYYGLRDYGSEGQYGLEASPAEYVETMRRLFAECRRVLAREGVLWLNLGDSYSGMRGNVAPAPDNKNRHDHADTPGSFAGKGVERKNLLGIPWRVAFALQDDGWTLRNAIIWAKPNAMPESVTDRLSTRYEHVFLFSRSRSYWFDLDPIREERIYTTPPVEDNRHAIDRGDARYGGNARSMHTTGTYTTTGKNPGDVWTIPTQPFSGAHFAVMPLALAERAILAGCRPTGRVLDPFHGSGTTGLAATKHGRTYTGIDLSTNYLDLSLKTRLLDAGLPFGTEEVV